MLENAKTIVGQNDAGSVIVLEVAACERANKVKYNYQKSPLLFPRFPIEGSIYAARGRLKSDVT